jgi:hypothetical protein
VGIGNLRSDDYRSAFYAVKPDRDRRITFNEHRPADGGYLFSTGGSQISLPREQSAARHVLLLDAGLRKHARSSNRMVAAVILVMPPVMNSTPESISVATKAKLRDRRSSLAMTGLAFCFLHAASALSNSGLRLYARREKEIFKCPRARARERLTTTQARRWARSRVWRLVPFPWATSGNESTGLLGRGRPSRERRRGSGEERDSGRCYSAHTLPLKIVGMQIPWSA